MTLIKSISGIRGTIGGVPGEGLSPLDVVKFTAAYCTWAKNNQTGKGKLRIVVGRDARISGQMVNALVSGTLLGMGADVINIGLATTPTTELAVTAENADGGIILTASHNPKQWNALKLLNNKPISTRFGVWMMTPSSIAVSSPMIMVPKSPLRTAFGPIQQRFPILTSPIISALFAIQLDLSSCGFLPLNS